MKEHIKKPKLKWKEFPLIPEPLSAAGPDRPACAECKLGRGRQDLYTMPVVPAGYTGKVLAVTEYTEPLVLESFLAEAGLERKDVAVVAGTVVIDQPIVGWRSICRPSSSPS